MLAQKNKPLFECRKPQDHLLDQPTSLPFLKHQGGVEIAGRKAKALLDDPSLGRSWNRLSKCFQVPGRLGQAWSCLRLGVGRGDLLGLIPACDMVLRACPTAQQSWEDAPISSREGGGLEVVGTGECRGAEPSKPLWAVKRLGKVPAFMESSAAISARVLIPFFHSLSK